jgi:hypothetical protein
VQNSDGSLLLPGSQAANSYNGELASATLSSASTDGWQGLAFGGGGYFEATISIQGTPPGYLNADGWPSWWMMGVEWLANNYGAQWVGQANGMARWAEVDILEALFNSNVQAHSAAIDHWYQGGHYSAVQEDVGPNQASLSQQNTYAVLWIPAADNSQGSLTYYINSVQVGQVFWDKWTAGQRPALVAGLSEMSVIDQQHMLIILGNSNVTTNTPMTIHSVHVWQANTAGNIQH